jgi:hypothetical protein
MQKFVDIYKKKLNEAEIRQENKVLEDFRKIYSAMLDHYGLTAVQDLNEESQLSFLTELNHYWSEEEGLNEKGEKFLQKRSMALNENSTAVQKKNFLREKSYIIINETLRQSGVKYKIYDIIDEMYNQLQASDLSDILTPDMITNIIAESFQRALDKFTENIKNELSESVTPKRKYFVKVKTK